MCCLLSLNIIFTSSVECQIFSAAIIFQHLRIVNYVFDNIRYAASPYNADYPKPITT